MPPANGPPQLPRHPTVTNAAVAAAARVAGRVIPADERETPRARRPAGVFIAPAPRPLPSLPARARPAPMPAMTLRQPDTLPLVWVLSASYALRRVRGDPAKHIRR